MNNQLPINQKKKIIYKKAKKLIDMYKKGLFGWRSHAGGRQPRTFKGLKRKLLVLYIADGTKLSKKFIQIMGGGKSNI